MSKFKADTNVGVEDAVESQAAPEQANDSNAFVQQICKDDLTSKAATVGAVVVGAALIEAAWIPAILVGAAAAVAPSLFPKIGERIEPLLNSAVRGTYKAMHKVRSAVGEVQERVQDIAAEVQAEAATKAPEADAGGKPA
ncbi:MAG: DUF5132 domain-containing protein [Burkholderiaceae bacterium]|nr:DUF5132 domain-containing protein [Burkholderiaceae bacterium]